MREGVNRYSECKVGDAQSANAKIMITLPNFGPRLFVVLTLLQSPQPASPAFFPTLTMNATALSNLSLSNSTQPIDLTTDDDEVEHDPYSDMGRIAKRPRTEEMQSLRSPTNSFSNQHPYLSSATVPSISRNSTSNPLGSMSPSSPIKPGFLQSQIARPGESPTIGSPQGYRPAFAGPSAFFSNGRGSGTPSSSHHMPPGVSNNISSVASTSRQVIDLTGSPSPPPQSMLQHRQLTPSISPLPNDLPPKTPVCIGQLTVTALVLYPVPYLRPQDPSSNDAEWATVQLRYEHNPNKPGGAETIHIVTPRTRAPNGEAVQGEGFGVVEQKVATSLGPMLGKGLIRLDGKVRKGMPNVSEPPSTDKTAKYNFTR